MHGIRQCFEMSGYFASSKFRFTDISQNVPNFREVNAVNLGIFCIATKFRFTDEISLGKSTPSTRLPLQAMTRLQALSSITTRPRLCLLIYIHNQFLKLYY